MDSKIIKKFQFPMDSAATPYNVSQFSPVVKQICHDESEFLDILKQSSWRDTDSAEVASKQIAASRGRLRIAKCIVVGDVSVGKTCLVHRFVERTYASNLKATTGVDFEVQKFDILDRPYTLQIWDTAGHSRFQDITRTYYRGAHAVLICFDLGNFQSFLKLKQWLDQVLESQQDGDTLPFIFLVGTKLDLFTDMSSATAPIQIEQEARQVADQLGAEFWQISSRNGTNVDELFNRIACLTFDRYMNLVAEQAQRDLDVSKKTFYSKLASVNGTKNSANKRKNKASECENGESRRTPPSSAHARQSSPSEIVSNPGEVPSPKKRRRKPSWMRQAFALPCGMIVKFANCVTEQVQSLTSSQKTKPRKGNKVGAGEFELNDHSRPLSSSPKTPISTARSPSKQSKRKAFRCFNIKCTFAVEP